MNLELICIGNELLSGRTQDKNGPWLGRFLEDRGYSLNRITTISDKTDEIINALNQAFSRSEVVFLSGGLGPTKDDLTKSALADFYNVEMVEDLNAKQIAIKNYKRKGLEFLDKSSFYQLIPKGFLTCNNPKGLAPGLIKLNSKKALFAAPGVPWEFATMVEKEFFPLFEKTFDLNNKEFGKFTIRTYGIPEESIFFKLVPDLWEQLSQFGNVASLPQIQGVDIVISHIDKSKFKKFEKEIKNILRKTPLAQFIWQFGEASLESTIINLAKKKKITIGLAESATGGMVSHRLTNIPGSSDQYRGSVVSYSNESKIKLLGVNRQTLKKNGPVSLEVAKEMAIGAQKALKAKLTISITGIAGPTGGEPNRPVGTVCIGWAFGKKHGSNLFRYRGDRATLKAIFTQKALFSLLEILKKQ